MTIEETLYERGVRDGQVDARLRDHDLRFEKINGSMDRLAVGMESLTLVVQRLGDQAISRDATVLTTAAALKDAEEARRDKSDSKWSPFARTATLSGALTGVVGAFLTFYLTFHH